MTKLLETWRNFTHWLFAERHQFAGAPDISSKAYTREWRRRQIESIREAQLRQQSKDQRPE